MNHINSSQINELNIAVNDLRGKLWEQKMKYAMQDATSHVA
jgi:hypothetical protein